MGDGNKSPSIEFPKLIVERDDSSISGLDDNLLNDDNYDDSFENGEAGKRIISRLSDIEKRNCSRHHYDLQINPDVAPTRNMKSEANGTQLQELQGKKVRGRKALTTKLKRHKSSSFERINHVELKTPKQTERIQPYENSIESEEV